MTVVAEKLYADLLALPREDRAELTHRLLDSLAPEPPGWCEDDPGFLEELKRREADMRSGKSIPIPVEEVFAKIDAKLAARKAARQR